MKFSAAALLMLAGYASAGSPELSLTLKDGSYGSVKSAMEPVVNFSGESNGIEYGGSLDLASEGIPKSIWGQKSTSVGGWNLKTRATLSQGLYDFGEEDSGAYVTVQGTDEDEETFVWGAGTVSKGDVSALKIGAKKLIKLTDDGGKFMVAPRYSFSTRTAKVVLGFEKDDTSAYLTVSEDDKNLLLAQKLDDNNSATFKVGTAGFISASVTNESDLGSTTATLTPDEVDVEMKNDGWVAGIRSSKSLADAEPTVRFSKTISFGG